jgi:hypothetical protein
MEYTNNNLGENSLSSSKLFEIYKDFCKWIRFHENLYQCLLKIKNTILNNKIIVFYLVIVYYLYQQDKHD